MRPNQNMRLIPTPTVLHQAKGIPWNPTPLPPPNPPLHEAVLEVGTNKSNKIASDDPLPYPEQYPPNIFCTIT